MFFAMVECLELLIFLLVVMDSLLMLGMFFFLSISYLFWFNFFGCISKPLILIRNASFWCFNLINYLLSCLEKFEPLCLFCNIFILLINLIYFFINFFIYGRDPQRLWQVVICICSLFLGWWKMFKCQNLKFLVCHIPWLWNKTRIFFKLRFRRRCIIC